MNKLCCVLNPKFLCTSCDTTLCDDCIGAWKIHYSTYEYGGPFAICPFTKRKVRIVHSDFGQLHFYE